MGIRPIVSSCESPTENISQFLDFWLQSLMKALPSYLKNTTELINELKDLTVESDTILVTIDVKSLYTCIPHQEGIETCREVLYSNNESNPTRPDIIVLICLLKIVLKAIRSNLISFINKYKEQQWKIKLAPAYANIFIGKLEHSILSHASFKPTLYRHYIDDILMLWPHYARKLSS